LSQVNKSKQVEFAEVYKYSKIQQITILLDDPEMHIQRSQGSNKKEEFTFVNDKLTYYRQQSETWLKVWIKKN
jgi:hypothetical protein